MWGGCEAHVAQKVVGELLIKKGHLTPVKLSHQALPYIIEAIRAGGLSCQEQLLFAKPSLSPPHRLTQGKLSPAQGPSGSFHSLELKMEQLKQGMGQLKQENQRLAKEITTRKRW